VDGYCAYTLRSSEDGIEYSSDYLAVASRVNNLLIAKQIVKVVKVVYLDKHSDGSLNYLPISQRQDQAATFPFPQRSRPNKHGLPRQFLEINSKSSWVASPTDEPIRSNRRQNLRRCFVTRKPLLSDGTRALVEMHPNHVAALVCLVGCQTHLRCPTQEFSECWSAER